MSLKKTPMPLILKIYFAIAILGIVTIILSGVSVDMPYDMNQPGAKEYVSTQIIVKKTVQIAMAGVLVVLPSLLLAIKRSEKSRWVLLFTTFPLGLAMLAPSINLYCDKSHIST